MVTGRHERSQEMYNNIATWKGGLPFGKQGWNRFGFLGMMCDFVINNVKGDILEIGTGESSVYLSYVARKYKRKVYHCDYSISGMVNLKSVDGIFNKNSVAYTGKSDDFFNDISFTPIAFAFIDGDHVYESVKKDFFNTLPLMVDDGYIFLHDTLPPDDSWKVPTRCGTVFMLREEIEKISSLEIFSFPHSAMNVGLSMVRKKN